MFLNASHVAYHDLADAKDMDIWRFAQQADFAIVTKDSDFNDLSALYGAPPKVIWIRLGNCTTDQVETLLRRHAQVITRFLEHKTERLLEIIPLTVV